MATPLGPGPLVYAHRGDRAHAADNTLEAFELAVANGADGIELDVQYTRDWHLVVFHDEHHPRAGIIGELTAAELRTADATVPTFAEALGTIGNRCFINVEIKNSAWAPSFDRRRNLARLVPAAIEDAGVGDQVVVSSFDAVMVAMVRTEAPELLTAQLLLEPDPHASVGLAADAGHDAVNIPRTWLAEDPTQSVAAVHRLGLAVGVWTVNDVHEIAAFAAAGADVLITDDPGAARAVLSG